MAPKDLEKVIYFAAYMVISVDEEARHRDLPTHEANLRLEIKNLGDRRDARVAARLAKLEEELAALEAEGAKADQKKKVKDAAEKEMASIRKNADDQVAKLERMWDEFRASPSASSSRRTTSSTSCRTASASTSRPTWAPSRSSVACRRSTWPPRPSRCTCRSPRARASARSARSSA
jgi:hypothetical protein